MLDRAEALRQAFPDPRPRVLARPAAGAGRDVGVPARSGAAVPLPGQPDRADPRADVQAGVREAVFNKARVIVTLGNRAVHSHHPDSRERRPGGRR